MSGRQQQHPGLLPHAEQEEEESAQAWQENLRVLQRPHCQVLVLYCKSTQLTADFYVLQPLSIKVTYKHLIREKDGV